MGVTGGKSQGVYVVSEADIAAGRFRVQPGPAIKVSGLQSATRGILGGNAIPVYVVSDPSARGVEGGEALPVSNLTGIRAPEKGLAIPVYVVSDEGQFGGGVAPFVGPYDAYEADFLVAYSMRRLFTSYAGKPFRLLRTSDDDEFVPSFTGSGDTDEAAVDDFLNGADGRILRWFDQKGAWIGDDDGTDGEDLAQDEPLRQYLYVANGQNGHPSFRSLAVAPENLFYSLRFPDPAILHNQVATSVFITVKYRLVGSILLFADRNANVSGPVILACNSPTANFRVRSRRDPGGAIAAVNSVAVADSSTFYAQAVTYDFIARTVKQYVNGVGDGSLTGQWADSDESDFTDVTRSIWLGGNAGGGALDGEISEFMLGNMVWDDETHAALHEIADAYWAYSA